MEILREIKRGAESVIYDGYFAGIHSIFKKRLSKPYRDPIIDKEINSSRTKLEARLMFNALENGVNVPALLFVDPQNYLIVMEYIEGDLVKDLIPSLDTEKLRELGEKIGEILGKLHKAEIAHGDPTTSNLILSDELFIIDFGLSKKTNDIEDFATDVHVFLRSLESIHSEFEEPIIEGFKIGYGRYLDVKSVFEKVKEIRMRGRYVEERRKKK